MVIPKSKQNMFSKLLTNKKVRQSVVVENGLEANNLVGALQESQKQELEKIRKSQFEVKSYVKSSQSAAR